MPTTHVLFRMCRMWMCAYRNLAIRCVGNIMVIVGPVQLVLYGAEVVLVRGCNGSIDYPPGKQKTFVFFKCIHHSFERRCAFYAKMGHLDLQTFACRVA